MSDLDAPPPGKPMAMVIFYQVKDPKRRIVVRYVDLREGKKEKSK